MNDFLTKEQLWRNAAWQRYDFWDRVADSVNPLLFVLLMGAALWMSRTSHARAWRFLGRSLLAVIVTLVAVKLLQRMDWFEAGRDLPKIRGDFPSSHMAVAVAVATSLFFASRKWLALVPILFFYAWLITALRFHLWIDLWGGALLSLLLTSLVQTVLPRRRAASSQTRRTSSTRSASSRTSSKRVARNESSKSSDKRRTTTR